MAIAVTLHILAAVIWVGGMFFAYIALRPAAQRVLDPQPRLALWSQVFQRFFPWVFATIVALLATGYWMIFKEHGGFAGVGLNVKIMHITGIIMMLIFGHVFFAPFRRLRRAVVTGDYDQAGKNLAQIRILIAINLALGIITTVIAAAGPHLLYLVNME